MYRLLKPIFFRFDPERIHYVVMALLFFVYRFPGGRSMLRGLYVSRKPALGKEVMGLHFPNPVGLAAGFDKDARWFNELACLGFGFVEIGTVTPQAQLGNDKPRLFRLPKDEALINRMGFNNRGAKDAALRLKNRNEQLIIGGNIGKNKSTPNEDALNDYLACYHDLYEGVDYFVVNVSSPNTPGLRALQDKEPLQRILHALQEENKKKPKPKPILLKIAPDLENAQLDDIVEIIHSSGIAGVIATNTTISRGGLKTSSDEVEAKGAGGLSGKPLTQRSTEVIRYLAEKGKKSFVIIGVGGIHSPSDAQEKLDAGADLVQLYTGFIYEGPGLTKRICNAMG